MAQITIRNAALADAPRILQIYAWYVEHTVITFEYTVPLLAEFEGRMRHTMQKYPYLVIERMAASRATLTPEPLWAAPPMTGPAS